MPYIIFWDEDQARQSAIKILEHSRTLYPGHDKPFTLQGDQIKYLQGAGMTMVGALDPVSRSFEVSTAPYEEQPIFVMGRAAEKRREREGGASA